MVLKKDSRLVPSKISDVHQLWALRRHYSALLRSQGHFFRDGRWSMNDDEMFHVHEVHESLGRGFPIAYETMRFLSHSDGDFNAPTLTHFTPTLCRGYDESWYYGESGVVHPSEPEEIDSSSFTLELNAQGTKWIVDNRPGNPIAHLGQFVAELRDFPQLPIFLRQRSKEFRDLGSEYLNIEFGWKPFIKDLISAYRLSKVLHEKLSKLIVNNGIPIRRRSKKKLEISDPTVVAEGMMTHPFCHLGDLTRGGSPELDGYYVFGPLGSDDFVFDTDYTGDIIYHLTESESVTTWNCGTFKYYVPDIGSDRWTRHAINALFGANPTPSVIYEVIPWSWLIDWFSNVGDIISNLSNNAVDNETLTNCYAMKTIQVTRTVEARVNWSDSSIGEPGWFPYFRLPAGAVSLKHRTDTVDKLRRQSSPFGFGVPSSSFSARQWAILAALGITKVHK